MQYYQAGAADITSPQNAAETLSPWWPTESQRLPTHTRRLERDAVRRLRPQLRRSQNQLSRNHGGSDVQRMRQARSNFVLSSWMSGNIALARAIRKYGLKVTPASG